METISTPVCHPLIVRNSAVSGGGKPASISSPFSQVLQNGDDIDAGLPPPDTAEFLTIDPVTDTILRRDPLPTTCSTPHGIALDEGQHQAFIACTDVDPGPPLVQHLMRWNLDTMKPGP